MFVLNLMLDFQQATQAAEVLTAAASTAFSRGSQGKEAVMVHYVSFVWLNREQSQ